MNEKQYALMWGRRQQFNDFVWQTPALSTAALGFLLSQSFDPDISKFSAIVLSGSALILGIALIQILARHRYHELNDAHLMAEFEREDANAAKGYVLLHGPYSQKALAPKWLGKYPAVRTWFIVLMGFCLLSVYSVVDASLRSPASPKTGAVASSMSSAPAKPR